MNAGVVKVSMFRGGSFVVYCVILYLIDEDIAGVVNLIGEGVDGGGGGENEMRRGLGPRLRDRPMALFLLQECQINHFNRRRIVL